VAVRIDDGLITGLYVVRNPEKLSRVERENPGEPLSPEDSVGRSARRVGPRASRIRAVGRRDVLRAAPTRCRWGDCGQPSGESCHSSCRP